MRCASCFRLGIPTQFLSRLNQDSSSSRLSVWQEHGQLVSRGDAINASPQHVTAVPLLTARVACRMIRVTYAVYRRHLGIQFAKVF